MSENTCTAEELRKLAKKFKASKVRNQCPKGMCVYQHGYWFGEPPYGGEVLFCRDCGAMAMVPGSQEGLKEFKAWMEGLC